MVRAFYCCLRSCFVFFFFSSRRRHTRCLSDWSSDVCSSDLHDVLTNFGASRFNGGLNLVANLLGKPGKMDVQGRSEERRVGKECRSRWSTYHKKKKIERRKKRTGKKRKSEHGQGSGHTVSSG